MKKRVTEEMNDELDGPFTGAEVEKALFQMKPNKSPSMDGFNANFF